MQATQDAVLGTGMIVLYKGGVNTRFAESFFVPGFHEEAALVAKDLGLYEFYVGDFGFGDFHHIGLFAFDQFFQIGPVAVLL
jgi:hypothetical protein